MYFNPNFDEFFYCSNIDVVNNAKELWSANGADMYYLGKVGIRNANPLYQLDIGLDSRSQNLIINGNLGINTPTPTEKFEIKDREITINRKADNYNWRIRNSDASDILTFIDSGIGIFNINYGGNISIGTIKGTQKLWVEGNVGYAENLTLEGKGIVSNTNADQLVLHTFTSLATGTTFNIPNAGCETTDFSFRSETFTASPAVFLG